MTRRNMELLLLVVAAPIVVLLFAMLVVTGGRELSFNTLGVPIGIFAAFIVSHLAVRKLAPGADPALLPIAFALSGIGIAFVTRLAPELAARQLIWLFLGVACMLAVLFAVRNLDRLGGYKYTLVVAGVLLLAAPMIPGLGQEILGSRIWIYIGPFSFQPGEIAKICIVLFLASYLAQNREMLSVFTWDVGPVRLPSLPTLVPLLAMWALAFGIAVFEKDLGSALVFFLVFLVMIYAATGKKFYVLAGLVLAAVAAVVLWTFFGHVQQRVDIWLDPFADSLGTGYQLVQSIFSLADGGLFGTGIGRGMADVIPVVESDFIFTAIAEETGLLGAAGVLLLYLCFAVRGMLTAAQAKSDVSSFAATGLTAIIILQAFIIVGGVTRLIPLTGITLPFVSQGGSSLLAGFLIVALLLRCGDEGTGVGEEMTSGTSLFNANSVLGRVALGKRLTNVLMALALLLALLIANLTLIMVIRAEEYQNMPGNSHTLAREAGNERGAICTYDGVVLARSVEGEDGTFERVYPAGDLASHVVGYVSTRYGTSGIEAACNDTLRGEENYASWRDVVSSLAGAGVTGNDVTLTLDSRIQQAAQDAIAGYVGACVVIDPSTGAMRGVASSPTYNAGDFEALLEQAAAGEAGDSSVMYNRATQAVYAPGSTFKMISLATALESGVASEDTMFEAPGSTTIGNAEVTNFNEADYGEITLARATELSSNTVFGQLGTTIGAERLVAGAEKFGFNKELDFELPVSMSLMPDPDEMTLWETAWAAAGEPVGEHASPAGPQATVLQMALSGCAIANGGTIMRPYLVEGVSNANGVRGYTASPSVLAKAVSPSVADRVLEVLKGVVAQGTGTPAAIPGVDVAGKTGTAESKGREDSSWFVGIASVDGGSPVVVALTLEHVGGSASAAAQARGVIQTALSVQGDL